MEHGTQGAVNIKVLDHNQVLCLRYGINGPKSVETVNPRVFGVFNLGGTLHRELSVQSSAARDGECLGGSRMRCVAHATGAKNRIVTWHAEHTQIVCRNSMKTACNKHSAQ
jgi:hypothetical protein